MAAPDATALCPYGGTDARGRPLGYAACCGRYLDHWADTPAPDPESLMRSRYSAFVRERADYLLASWHPHTRPPGLAFDPGARWLGLEVRRHRLIDDAHAEVEFVARSRLHGRATRLHELSRFMRENDADDKARWFYVDGTIY